MAEKQGRRKGGAKAASSGRAANLVATDGGFVGFDSLAASDSAEPHHTRLDANFKALFQKLDKQDIQTKAKALERLRAELADADTESAVAAWRCWVGVYPKLAHHGDFKVRQASHRVTGCFCERLGRDCAKQLKQTLPHWYLGVHDTYPEVAQTADDALQSTFAGAKRLTALSTFKTDICQVCCSFLEESPLLIGKANKTCDTDETSALRVRRLSVVSLRALAGILSQLDESARLDIVDSLRKVLFETGGRWKALACHEAVLTRCAALNLVAAILRTADASVDAFRPHLFATAPTVLTNLDAADLVLCRAAWDAWLLLLTRFDAQQVVEGAGGMEAVCASVLPALSACVSDGRAAIVGPCLLVTLDACVKATPSASVAAVDQAGLFRQWFSALIEGVSEEAVPTSDSNVLKSLPMSTACLDCLELALHLDVFEHADLFAHCVTPFVGQMLACERIGTATDQLARLVRLATAHAGSHAADSNFLSPLLDLLRVSEREDATASLAARLLGDGASPAAAVAQWCADVLQSQLDALSTGDAAVVRRCAPLLDAVIASPATLSSLRPPWQGGAPHICKALVAALLRSRSTAEGAADESNSFLETVCSFAIKSLSPDEFDAFTSDLQLAGSFSIGDCLTLLTAASSQPTATAAMSWLSSQSCFNLLGDAIRDTVSTRSLPQLKRVQCFLHVCVGADDTADKGGCQRLEKFLQLLSDEAEKLLHPPAISPLVLDAYRQMFTAVAKRVQANEPHLEVSQLWRVLVENVQLSDDFDVALAGLAADSADSSPDALGDICRIVATAALKSDHERVSRALKCTDSLLALAGCDEVEFASSPLRHLFPTEQQWQSLFDPMRSQWSLLAFSDAVLLPATCIELADGASVDLADVECYASALCAKLPFCADDAYVAAWCAQFGRRALCRAAACVGGRRPPPVDGSDDAAHIDDERLSVALPFLLRRLRCSSDDALNQCLFTYLIRHWRATALSFDGADEFGAALLAKAAESISVSADNYLRQLTALPSDRLAKWVYLLQAGASAAADASVADILGAWLADGQPRFHAEVEAEPSDWHQAVLLVSLSRLLQRAVDALPVLSSEQRDYLLCNLVSSLQTLAAPSLAFAYRHLVGVSVWRLFVSCADRFALDVDAASAHEWRGFFLDEAARSLLPSFLALADGADVDESLAATRSMKASSECVARLGEAQLMGVALPTLLDAALDEKRYPASLQSVVLRLAPLLEHPFRCVQTAAAAMLECLTGRVFAVETDVADGEAGGDVAEEEEEAGAEAALKPPSFLLGVVAHCYSLIEASVVGHAEELCSADGPLARPVLGYLLAWRLLFRFFSQLSAFKRPAYSNYLRESRVMENLLFTLFCLMPKNPSKSCEIGQTFSSPVSEERSVIEVETMACDLYLSALQTFPVLVRHWFNSLDRSISTEVDKVTTRHFTPVICQRELDAVGRGGKQHGNMSMAVRPAVREVVARYVTDDWSMELIAQLPPNYPLGQTRVEAVRAPVANSVQRKWLLQLTVFLSCQNGSLEDGLLLWKGNIEKHLQGVDDCMICMMTVHSGNYQLPRVCCRQCKKKFHGACLYKWFHSSSTSNCPLCRSPF